MSTVAMVAGLLCGGTAVAAETRSVCGGAEVPVDATSYGRPFVHMRLGSVSGAFLVDTGSTSSALDAASYGQPIGARVSAVGSSLPTVSGGDGLRVADLSGQPGPSRTTGIVGTDFLSTRTVEFHYEGPDRYLVVSERPCPDPAGRGLLRFDQRGLFGPPSAGRPLDANVPAAFMRLGPVRFRAWIDTGFFEAVPDGRVGVVKVNAALLAALRAAGVPTRPEGSVTSMTCDGASRSDPLLRATGALLEEGADPSVAVRDPLLQAVGRDACGGPGDVGAPLAMVGAAWLSRWGTTVLDPLSGAVWVGKAAARGDGEARR